MRNQTSRGFILLTVLVFLAVFAVITVGVFETTLLSGQMAAGYEDKLRSFQAAEQCLLTGERRLLAGAADHYDHCVQVHRLEPGYSDGSEYYVLIAIGKYREVTTMLRSVVVRTADPSLSGRQSFLWYQQDNHPK